MPDLFLERYFERVGLTSWRGSKPPPTLETLNQIIHAQVTHIPFENLDVLLGRDISLEREAVFNKLVLNHRGGYCFELNSLLLWILEELGFQVIPLSARVRWNHPREFIPPRTHMFLRVEIEDVSWLADVGIGGAPPTCGLRLLEESQQQTPHECFRLVREGGIYFEQILIGGEWRDVKEFTLEWMPQIDRELANWFTCASPKSHFKNRLIAALAGPNGARFTLLNHDLTLRHGVDKQDGVGLKEQYRIETPEALLQVLKDRFGLHFETGTRFGPLGSPWPR